MPWVRGARLGPYEILEPLGAAMGEVYRARDTRLGRAELQRASALIPGTTRRARKPIP